MANDPRQAVLLIHGIGEQRTMDTLRGFVRAVWTEDEDIKHQCAVPGVYSKPDTVSGSFELRRLTTTKNRNGVYTDFFEFYWAHLMHGTTLNHVTAWAKRLLLRSPWKVPSALRGLWLLLVTMLLAVAFLGVQAVLPEAYRIARLPQWLTGVLGAIVGLAIVPMLKKTVGDAARYLDPSPSNIRRREEIRVKGVDLLLKLHDSGDYDRIIVVGHSLGSVIGYDILTHAWARVTEDLEIAKVPVLDDMEEALAAAPVSSCDFREKQRRLQEELAANDCRWLVTDFLTLGSPLTHASILLANDAKDLRSKQEERELPTCPPALEKGKFSYPTDRVKRKPHHAAVFGPARWTNLYFPACCVAFGDLVGGPLRPAFGSCVDDREVRTSIRWGLLSHTFYWTQGNGAETAPHIRELRDALNLLDKRPDATEAAEGGTK